MFALLILKVDEKIEVQQRYVICVPRTEVKWMTVIGYGPLYRFANLNDLKRIAEEVKNASH